MFEKNIFWELIIFTLFSRRIVIMKAASIVHYTPPFKTLWSQNVTQHLEKTNWFFFSSFHSVVHNAQNSIIGYLGYLHFTRRSKTLGYYDSFGIFFNTFFFKFKIKMRRCGMIDNETIIHGQNDKDVNNYRSSYCIQQWPKAHFCIWNISVSE